MNTEPIDFTVAEVSALRHAVVVLRRVAAIDERAGDAGRSYATAMRADADVIEQIAGRWTVTQRLAACS